MGAFKRHAKARTGKPIESQTAIIPDEQSLYVDASSGFDSSSKPAQKLTFAPGINVDEYVANHC
jgi:hypothetical protein